MGYRRIGYSSSTFLIVLAISLFVRGFMAKALMPAAFALSASTTWLKPVHMMIGISGPDGEDLFRKLDARHFRHGLVGNDKIEAGWVQL